VFETISDAAFTYLIPWTDMVNSLRMSKKIPADDPRLDPDIIDPEMPLADLSVNFKSDMAEVHSILGDHRTDGETRRVLNSHLGFQKMIAGRGAVRSSDMFHHLSKSVEESGLILHDDGADRDECRRVFAFAAQMTERTVLEMRLAEFRGLITPVAISGDTGFRRTARDLYRIGRVCASDPRLFIPDRTVERATQLKSKEFVRHGAHLFSRTLPQIVSNGDPISDRSAIVTASKGTKHRNPEAATSYGERQIVQALIMRDFGEVAERVALNLHSIPSLAQLSDEMFGFTASAVRRALFYRYKARKLGTDLQDRCGRKDREMH